MKYIRCKLLDGDNVIAEDIDVLLEETQTILRSWRGRFELPITKNLKSGSSFKIMLEDGRSGEIIILDIKIISQSNNQLVRFTGTGPLK
jgi:hypothetical protein